VNGRVQTARSVHACVKANSSCALVYSLVIRMAPRASYCGADNAKKSIRMVRSVHNCDLIVAWLTGDLVDVTRWQPWLSIVPLRLPGIASKMTTCVVEVTCTRVTQLGCTGRYTQTLTLALFLLNVLPLPRLDGGELMDAVHYHLDATSSAEVDIEIGSRDRSLSSRSPRHRYTNKILRGITTGLLGGCVMLGLYDSTLRKYAQTSG
jgi:hypothetical protein